ncbi:MAG: ion channel [Paracoccaceae bacterium]|nr:ion channel [Paracoccaceae bacterium]
MVSQLGLGAALILATILIGAGVWLGLELAFLRLHGWLMRPPHRPKLVAALVVALLGTLAMITVSVWLWALAFYGLGIFADLEAALYFSLVAFTTLGFGDVLLPLEWRLLGGMTAANGFLSFGLVTALLVETLRNVRIGQRDWMS